MWNKKMALLLVPLMMGTMVYGQYPLSYTTQEHSFLVVEQPGQQPAFICDICTQQAGSRNEWSCERCLSSAMGLPMASAGQQVGVSQNFYTCANCKLQNGKYACAECSLQQAPPLPVSSLPAPHDWAAGWHCPANSQDFPVSDFWHEPASVCSRYCKNGMAAWTDNVENYSDAGCTTGIACKCN